MGYEKGAREASHAGAPQGPLFAQLGRYTPPRVEQRDDPASLPVMVQREHAFRKNRVEDASVTSTATGTSRSRAQPQGGDAPGAGAPAARRPRDRLAVAVRSRHDSLGCQGAFPTADSVPGAKPCRRPVSVLGTLRVQRPSANRRSSVDDLCPAVSCPCARQRCAEPPGRRYHPIGHALSQWRRTDFMVPRSALALGRRAARRPGLLLWRLDGLAHSAHWPGAEPRLPATGPADLRSSTGALLAAVGHCRRHRDGRHRARPRSSGLARHLFAGCLCPLAHCRPHHSHALPCVPPCCH